MEKLQIYYQASKTDKNMKSLTISYYDFDEQTNTFKQKIVLEKDHDKYKIKRMYGWLGNIRPFMESIDLKKCNSSQPAPDDAYFYIKYGDQTLTTNNPDDIRSLLDWVKFDEIITYDLSMYTKCE